MKVGFVSAILPDYTLDFHLVLGEQMEWSVAYALCYLWSETPQAGLVMKVGSDDEAKIFLNGKLLYQSVEARALVSDSDTVTGVELKAGLNVLVLKVVNEISDWQASVRFTDRVDQRVKGLQVRLAP